MRLNSDHHALLLDFAEQNTQIITNCWTGLAGNQNSKNLWEILANKLNSLGYGTLSVTEYKRRLTDWKSKTKGKAASLRYQVIGTGGGPKMEIQLTDHEKRLLALMGNISYEGDNVREIGGVLSQCYSTVTHSSPLTTQKNISKNSNIVQVHSDITSTPRSTPRLSLGRDLQSYSTVAHSSPLATQKNISKNSNIVQVHSDITSTPRSTPRLSFGRDLQREPPSLVVQSPFDDLESQNENESIQYNTDLELPPEEDIEISFVDHDYAASTQNTNSVENTDMQFKKRKLSQSKQNPSKSSERRTKVKGLSTEIKDMNNETLSVLKDIRGEFLNMNQNLNIISSSLSTLTKAVCTIAEKLN